MKGLIKSKLGKLLIPAMAGMLALSTIGGVYASSPADEHENSVKQGFFGTVTAKGESSFSLETKHGASLDLSVDSETKFRVPGETEANLDNLAIGSRVAVLAEGEGEARSALKVMVIPARPQVRHRVLTVVSVSGNLVIAEDAQGNRVEVELDHEISQDIEGQLITFIGALSEQSNRFKAHADVKIGQVVQRLEAQAKQLEAEIDAEARAEAKARKKAALAEIKARLEANMQQHLDLFQELIAKAPDRAKAKLEAALQVSLRGYKMALEAVGKSEAEIESRLTLRAAHGSVESVDAEAGKIKLSTRLGAELDLAMNEDTQVLIDGEAGSLADIAVGDMVTVRYNSETSTAGTIVVKTEAEAIGTIQSIDAENGQIVVELRNGAILTLNVTPETQIAIDGEAAALADLELNAQVEVEYNLKTKKALKIETEGIAEAQGTIQSIDRAEGTLVILTGDGQEITLTLSDSARVRIRGLLFGLLGVNSGLKVEAKYDASTDILLGLRAESEAEGSLDGEGEAEAQARGSISSVDIAEGTITIETDEGGTLTLSVDSNAEIQLNGEAVTLAELEEAGKARIKIKYNIETKIVSEIEASSSTGSSADSQRSIGSGTSAGGTTGGDASASASGEGSASESGEVEAGAGAGASSNAEGGNTEGEAGAEVEVDVQINN